MAGNPDSPPAYSSLQPPPVTLSEESSLQSPPVTLSEESSLQPPPVTLSEESSLQPPPVTLSQESSLQPPSSTLKIDIVEDTESICDNGAELLVNEFCEDKTTRLIFIQKVLTIKLLQLLGVAVVMGFAAGFETSCRWFMYDNTIHIVVTSLIACLVIFILMICCDEARRQKPYKYIFLVAYPLSIACFISSVTFWTALTEVAMAWGYHCVAVFALLVYNIMVTGTKFDFNTLHALHGFYISTGAQVFMYAICFPLRDYYPLYALYPTIVLALEHLYLLLALQVMTSKSYKTALTPDDYVDAALNLHIDYIYIFTKLLVPKIRHAWSECMELFVILYAPDVASIQSSQACLSPS